LREHLQAAYRQTGRKPADLDGPPCPPELAYVWSWFCQLSNGRTRGMGASPITWLDFDAWSRVTGVGLTAFERECITALDAEYLRERKAT